MKTIISQKLLIALLLIFQNIVNIVNAKDYNNIRSRWLQGGNNKKPISAEEVEFEVEVLEEKVKTDMKKQQKDIPPLKELPTSPTDYFHVFQISHTHVASTLTINILTGLFDGRDAYRSYLQPHYIHDWHHVKDAPWNSTLTTKSHIVDINELDNHFGPKGWTHQFDNLFFIGNVRAEEKTFLPDGYCDEKNDEYNWRVVCLEYEFLLYETMDELRDVVEYVTAAVNSIPFFSKIKFDQERAVMRIVDFDKVKENCSDRAKKYGIGGGNSCDRHIKDPPVTTTTTKATNNNP